VMPLSQKKACAFLHASKCLFAVVSFVLVRSPLSSLLPFTDAFSNNGPSLTPSWPSLSSSNLLISTYAHVHSYSQKEVRILAHMSGDRSLISLFRGDPNVDIYKQMSSLIRNKPVDAVTDTERAQFKQVTLALLYGMGPGQVAKKLSISKGSAQQMMSDFFRRFPQLKVWMDKTKADARKNLYVETIAGRKRYLDDINSNDNAKRSQAERQAVNSVIQGSAADLMKTAMIKMAANLMRWPDENRPLMLLQIHDEVVLEVRMKASAIQRLKSIAFKSCCVECEKQFHLKVPLLLTCSAGRSWGAMKDI